MIKTRLVWERMQISDSEGRRTSGTGKFYSTAEAASTSGQPYGCLPRIHKVVVEGGHMRVIVDEIDTDDIVTEGSNSYRLGRSVPHVEGDHLEETQRAEGELKYFFSKKTLNVLMVRDGLLVRLLSIAGVEIEGDPTAWKDIQRVAPNGYLEVTEADLPYLEKPFLRKLEGDWEFRKVELGDTYLRDDVVEFRESAPVNDVDLIACQDRFDGYRWCAPKGDSKKEEK